MIYKYTNIDKAIKLPIDSIPLSAAYQGDDLVYWVKLGSNKELVDFIVFAIGTGWDHDTDKCTYLNTVIDKEGYVWHIFYEKTE